MGNVDSHDNVTSEFVDLYGSLRSPTATQEKINKLGLNTCAMQLEKHLMVRIKKERKKFPLNETCLQKRGFKAKQRLHEVVVFEIKSGNSIENISSSCDVTMGTVE